MRRLLSRLLRRQDGIALPTVVGALTVVTGLAVGTFAISVENHHASSRDRDSKRALAAAEAGLQMAILRTSDLEPNETQCVTLGVLGPDEATNECPWTDKIPIGNGATYRYVVATPTTGTCATVPGFTPTPAKDRCITSVGTVNGVSRRLQMRFYYQPPFLPWGQAGLVGKNKVDIGNNKIIDSAIGTNGDVYLGNNSNAWELLLPDGSSYYPSNNATIDTQVAGGNAIRTPRVPEWEFPEIDWATPQITNNNSQLNGIPGWNSATKTLKLGQQQDITLLGGTYHLCGFDAPNGNDINVPAGQFVRMYIIGDNGHPACNENDPIDGKFRIQNSGRVNPLPTTDPKAEQFALFVYGTDHTDDNPNSDPVDVDINNGVSFWGTIWAPHSEIEIKNNQTVSGGFTGGTIEMKNNGGFSYDSDIANQSLPGTADAENLSWTECAKLTPGQTDPEAGCS